MEKLTFNRLVGTGVVLIAIANGVAFLLHAGFLVNLAWIVYGGIALLHPACPARWKDTDREKNAVLGIRIGGVLCVVVGVLTRFLV